MCAGLYLTHDVTEGYLDKVFLECTGSKMCTGLYLTVGTAENYLDKEFLESAASTNTTLDYI